MFTLKLYRRHPDSRTKMHKVMSVDRVVVMEIGVMEIGKEAHALELRVFPGPSNDYETYYVGKPEPGMDAFGRDDLHLGTDPLSWWGWGLLENMKGNTSEHYRPADFG